MTLENVKVGDTLLINCVRTDVVTRTTKRIVYCGRQAFGRSGWERRPIQGCIHNHAEDARHVELAYFVSKFCEYLPHCTEMADSDLKAIAKIIQKYRKKENHG